MVQWNKVTWYSKALAVILFLIVVPLLSFHIGRSYEAAYPSYGGVGSWGYQDDKIKIVTLINEYADDHSDQTAKSVTSALKAYAKKNPHDQPFVDYVNAAMSDINNPCYGIPLSKCRE